MSEINRPPGIDDDDVANDTVVLAHRVPLWRDCLVGSLEFESFAVLPFPTLAGWLDVRSKYPSPSVVLVCEPEQRELPLVAKVARELPTVVVAEGGAGLVHLLNDGVRGIITSGTAFAVALNAIRLVASGGTFIPADLLSKRESRLDFGNLLTERQLDVVEALRRGKANKQIARELNLRESTVKVHIRQIMRKLDARNRTEIAVLANELLEISRSTKEEA